MSGKACLFRQLPSRDRKGQPLGLLPGHGDLLEDTWLDKWHCVISGCLCRVVRWHQVVENRPTTVRGQSRVLLKSRAPFPIPGDQACGSPRGILGGAPDLRGLSGPFAQWLGHPGLCLPTLLNSFGASPWNILSALLLTHPR